MVLIGIVFSVLPGTVALLRGLCSLPPSMFYLTLPASRSLASCSFLAIFIAPYSFLYIFSLLPLNFTFAP